MAMQLPISAFYRLLAPIWLTAICLVCASKPSICVELEVWAINDTNAKESPSSLPPAEAVPAGLDWSGWLTQPTDVS